MGPPTDPSSAAADSGGEGGEPAPGAATPADAVPRARRGLGAVGRSVLLAVGLVVAFLVGLTAVVVLTGDGQRTVPEGSAGPATGPLDPAPGSLPDGGAVPATLPPATLAGFGDGDPVELAAYRGRPLLVNFWATWCAPCVDEMPALQAVYAEVDDQMAFLGVDVRDAPANAEPFVEELGITYDLAVDADGDYYRDLGSRGMPTTLLVDADGRIVDHHTGALTAEQLRELLARQLDVQA